MYEQDDILVINVHWWTNDEYCTHVIFKDGSDYCSWYKDVTKPAKTDN